VIPQVCRHTAAYRQIYECSGRSALTHNRWRRRSRLSISRQT
jgi:hypothetical protein